MSEHVWHIERLSDIPGIALALREHVPIGTDCHVFVDGTGDVSFDLVDHESHSGLPSFRMFAPWTASELAHELLAHIKSRRAA